MYHMPLTYLVKHPRINVMWETIKSKDIVQDYHTALRIKVCITCVYSKLRKQVINVRVVANPMWRGPG